MNEQRFNPLAKEAAELHKNIAPVEKTLRKSATHENAVRLQNAKRAHLLKVEEARKQFRVV